MSAQKHASHIVQSNKKASSNFFRLSSDILDGLPESLCCDFGFFAVMYYSLEDNHWMSFLYLIGIVPNLARYVACTSSSRELSSFLDNCLFMRSWRSRMTNDVGITALELYLVISSCRLSIISWR